jgi:hypothetical protein
MKKWFAVLLLSVTATAILLPCLNRGCCCSDEFASDVTSHNNHKCEGNCSPFVTCGKCAGFTQTSNIVEVPVVSVEKPVYHSQVISKIFSSYITALFQPPREI